MSARAPLKQSFGFFVEEMGDEFLLYRLGAHKAIHLNQTAALIWKLADGTRTASEISHVLCEQYPAIADQVATDVQEAVDLLIREGALSATYSGSSPATGDPQADH